MFNRKYLVISILVLVTLSACASAPTEVTAVNPPAEPPPAASPATIEVAPAPATITVTGVSQVTVTPDIAFVTVGSRQEADSVVQAVENSNMAVEAITKALLAAEVAEEDIQTSNFSVYTQDQYDPMGQYMASRYVAENTVYITVRQLDKLGDVLGAAVKAGANTIWGIQFDLSDKTKALAEGRADAVQQAAQQASELAQAAGVTLGEIQSITHYSGYSVPYGMGMGGGGEGGYSAQSAVAISPGQMVLQVEVTIAYIIQ